MLDGGAGFDAASYSDATIGITASLATPGINMGEATGDVYVLDLKPYVAATTTTSLSVTLRIISSMVVRVAILSTVAQVSISRTTSMRPPVIVNITAPAGNGGEALGDFYNSIKALRQQLRRESG